MGILKINNVNPVYSVIAFRIGAASSRSNSLSITIGSGLDSIVTSILSSKEASELRGEYLYDLFANCNLAIGYASGDTVNSDIRIQALDPNLKAGVSEDTTGLTDQSGNVFSHASFSLEKTSYYKGDTIYIPYNNIIKIKKTIINLVEVIELYYGAGTIANKIMFTPGTVDTSNINFYNYLATSGTASYSIGNYTQNFFGEGNALDLLQERIEQAVSDSKDEDIVTLNYNSAAIKATS